MVKADVYGMLGASSAPMFGGFEGVLTDLYQHDAGAGNTQCCR